MSNEQDLKSKNTITLWIFFSFNVALLVSFFFAENIDVLLSDFKSILTIRTSGVLIAPLILFIVNGLLTPEVKSTLVYWKVKNVLPGCRSFSVLAKKDNRIDMDRLSEMYGPLPTLPQQQNKLWYKIYRLNREGKAIQSSHRRFLLGRDLTAIAFLFLLFSGLPFVVIGDLNISLLYIGCLISLYMLLVLATRNYGNRFVTNVLAAESSK